MPQSVLDEVKQLLNKLSAEELRIVKSRVSAMLSLERNLPQGNGEDERMVLSAICEVLARRGLEFVEPHMLVRSERGLAAFRDKLPGILKFINQSSRTRNEAQALLNIGVELLYEQQTKWTGFTASARSLMQQIHYLPACLNQAYPGYAACGMLSWALKNRG